MVTNPLILRTSVPHCLFLFFFQKKNNTGGGELKKKLLQKNAVKEKKMQLRKAMHFENTSEIPLCSAILYSYCN